MEVILERDYPQLGFVGDRVQISRGFGRNYLIPQGIAVEVNARNEKFLKNKMQAIATQRAKLKADAQALADKMKSETWEFTLKVGSKGKSFGSVSAKDVYELVIARGYEVDKKQVLLTDAVRSSGDYKFSVKLHSEVTAVVPLKVLADITAKSQKAEKNDAESETQTDSTEE